MTRFCQLVSGPTTLLSELSYGLMAIQLIAREGNWSVSDTQVVPPFIVLQIPPLTEPIKMTFELNGCVATDWTAPAKLTELLTIVPGPSSSHAGIFSS